jgi:predicted DNA-binding transcriptional regulator AlpA
MYLRNRCAQESIRFNQHKGNLKVQISTQPPRRRIVTREELRERLGGICFATIDNYVKRRILPRPIKLGPNRVGWLESDIDAYFDRLVAQRDAEVA